MLVDKTVDTRPVPVLAPSSGAVALSSVQARRVGRNINHLVDEVLNDEEKSLSYIRMKPSIFSLPFELIGLHITRRETNFRKPIPT